MGEYFRGSVAEPSIGQLREIFFCSSANDWIYDPDLDMFTFRENLLIFVRGDHNGKYKLRYGHMEVEPIDSNVIDSIGLLKVKEKSFVGDSSPSP